MAFTEKQSDDLQMNLALLADIKSGLKRRVDQLEGYGGNMDIAFARENIKAALVIINTAIKHLGKAVFGQDDDTWNADGQKE